VGLLLEYNGKVSFGLGTKCPWVMSGFPCGIPFGHVGNPLWDSLRNAFLLFSLYCIPLGLINSQNGGLLLEYREEEDGFYTREVLVL